MIATSLLALLLIAPVEEPTANVVVVVGAPGAEEFGSKFAKSADQWMDAAKRGGAKAVRLDGSNEAKSDRDALKSTLEQISKGKDIPLWLVFIGHGTFDGRAARFNLHGRDVTAKETRDWISAINRAAVINCSSASAPFINRLSGDNRVIVTATKSGSEQNYSRFGEYMSEAIGKVDADLDKDGQTSLLEAWLIAARRTQDFYKEAGRLATEHALIDDNGDERGTRYDAFKGLRPTSKGSGGLLDGFRAHQWHLVKGDLERSMPAKLVAERDALELAVIRLRERRSHFREDEYYAELEKLLIPLAKLYESADTGK